MLALNLPELLVLEFDEGNFLSEFFNDGLEGRGFCFPVLDFDLFFIQEFFEVGDLILGFPFLLDVLLNDVSLLLESDMMHFSFFL